MNEDKDQSGQDTGTGNAGGGDGQDIDNQDSNHGQDNLGVDVPPELKEKEKELMRAFHEKTQALAAKEKTLNGELEGYKKDANALYDLSKQEWFKQAIEAEKARRQGRVTSIDADTFEKIKQDPREFQDYLNKRDEAIREGLKAQFETKLQALGKSQQELSSGRQLDAAASKYGEDFVKAKDAGELDLQNYDPETAFKLYMQDQGKVAIPLSKKKTQLDPARERGGSVERGGMSSHRGGPVVKAKSLGDAIDRAFELARKGTKDYRIEKDS